MNKAILFNFFADKAKNTIKVERAFDAPVALVWAAWTEADILDQWWAPAPYKAVTKSLDFKEGGRWHYYMLSPEGERHWCLFDYHVIKPQKFFSGIDAFCDEYGATNNSKPRVRWENDFTPDGESTVVNILLQFESLEDLETILQMGFKEGFTAGLDNLDQYIAAQFALRKQNKPDTKVRVSTYVNFPGNTEEAFLFYKSVFNTEFVNGIHRFGEIPPDPAQPPIAENVKRMVLYVELPLIGGHILGYRCPERDGVYCNAGK